MRKRTYLIVLVIAALVIVAALHMRGQGRDVFGDLRTAIHGR